MLTFSLYIAPPVSISINIPDSQVQESDGIIEVELLLSRPSTKDISVNLQLHSGTASGMFSDTCIHAP